MNLLSKLIFSNIIGKTLCEILKLKSVFCKITRNSIETRYVFYFPLNKHAGAFLSCPFTTICSI